MEHFCTLSLTQTKRSRNFDQEEKDKRAKRLKFLVEKASIYSHWLAEKLEARQQERTVPW